MRNQCSTRDNVSIVRQELKHSGIVLESDSGLERTDTTKHVIQLMATGKLLVGGSHAEKQIPSLFMFKYSINSYSEVKNKS